MDFLKQCIKGILNAGWSFKRPALANRIIYYHSIHPFSSRSIKPSIFDCHLAWLKKNGFRSILVREIPDALMHPERFPTPWVALTFDDGYQDNVDYALPALKNAGFVATFFVVAGVIDGERNQINSRKGHFLYENRAMMTSESIKLLYSEGMEIGSHTLSHKLITKVLSLSRKEAEKELKVSKEVLEQIISWPVVSFSYPNGQRGAFSNQTRKLLHKIGYEVAVTTMWGLPTDSGSDMLQLPRCEISTKDELYDFQAKMEGLRDYNRYICLLLKRAKLWDTRKEFSKNI